MNIPKYKALLRRVMNDTVGTGFIKDTQGIPKIFQNWNQLKPWIRSHLTFLFSLTPRSRILLEKLIVFQPFKKLSALYGARKFIFVFTKTRCWNLSWATWIQSTHSSPMSLIPILILYSYPCLDLSYGLFHLGVPIKILYARFSLTRVLHALPSHPPWVDHTEFITRIVETSSWWPLLSITGVLCTFVKREQLFWPVCFLCCFTRRCFSLPLVQNYNLKLTRINELPLMNMKCV
jgi:hypothetical protein